MGTETQNSTFWSLLPLGIWLHKGWLGALLQTQLASGSQNQVPASRREGSTLSFCSREIFVHRKVQCVSVNSSKPDCAQEILCWKNYQVQKLHFTIQWLISCQLGSVHG